MPDYDVQSLTLTDVAEKRLSMCSQTALRVLIRYRGLLVYGYRPQEDKMEAEAYGEFAKTPNLWNPDRQPDFITRVLCTRDEFIAFDNRDVSLLSGGYFLSEYPFVTGDIIQFRRADAMRRFFSVSREVQLGVTRSVVRKFEYASYDA